MGTLSFPIAPSKSRLPSIRNPIAFPIPFLQTSFPSSSAFRPRNFPILHLRRPVLCAAGATGRSNHNDHHHVHDHHHHHGHHHGHHHCDHDVELSGLQKAVIGFAKAIRWTELANYLREHLQLCCCSMALFVAAAVCPYLVPKPIVKLLQNAFIVIAFPLVGVSSSLDALTDISGGKVNIHVLMALAAFASIFMGNALEGGLLLAMFNLSHIAEEYFSSRAMIDVKELKENYPDSALVLDTNDGELPNITDLSYRKVPVKDVEVDSYILVGAGEITDQTHISVATNKYLSFSLLLQFPKNTSFIPNHYYEIGSVRKS